MKALRLDKELTLEDVPQPTINNEEVLLKIRLAGICNTDIELIRGYKSFTGTLGHEFVADVIDGPPDLLGKRVVGEINIGCGICKFCQRDIISQCLERSAIGIANWDGAFAEYMRLPAQNVHIVPDGISDSQAVFTEPLAAACQILHQVHIQPNDKVIVIGAGKLGLLCAQVIKLTGANLSVIVRREKQKQVLRKWGIQAVRLEEIDKSNTKIVVDCTGNQDGFADSLDLIEPFGTIVLKSTYQGSPMVDMTQIAVKEITVVGSRCGPFETALRYLEQGLVDVESLVDARFSLDDGVEAIQHAQQKGILKVLLEI